jgi:hypothetical protein
MKKFQREHASLDAVKYMNSRTMNMQSLFKGELLSSTFIENYALIVRQN